MIIEVEDIMNLAPKEKGHYDTKFLINE